MLHFCPRHYDGDIFTATFCSRHFQLEPIYLSAADTSPAPEKSGKYLKTPFRPRRRLVFIHTFPAPEECLYTLIWRRRAGEAEKVFIYTHCYQFNFFDIDMNHRKQFMAIDRGRLDERIRNSDYREKIKKNSTRYKPMLHTG